MIYLENTTSAQTVSIPRNDNGGTPSINPRSYQEGYNAGFEAGEDVGFESGFTSGYTSGETHQKSLLSSTAITENGEYQSENGFSAITVDVPTGISIDLSSITITANTAITETDKAYTGITVNVPQTGYTQQDLDNAYNSGYTSGNTDGFASGYTSGETDGYESGYASGYTSGETNGYASGYSSGETVGYNSGYTNGYLSGETVGENNIISTFSAITATTNGVYGSSANPLSAVTVNVPTGTTNLNSLWFASNGVECSIIPDNGYFTISSSSNVTNRTYTIVRTNKQIPYHYKNKVYVGSIYNAETGSDDETLLAVFYNTSTNEFYVEEVRDFTSYTTATSGNQLTIQIIDGKVTNWDGMENGNYDGLSYVNVEINSAKTYNDGRQSIISTFSSTTATTNGEYGSSAHPLSSITVNVPQSGYTQQDLDNAYTSGYTNGYTSGEIIGYSSGYSSGKTDGYASGETSIINTFTAITATTNGAYGSSAHPLSSITVNVPQTGSSDVKYVEYIQTDGSKYAWDTGYAINSLDDEVYLDFMPLTGTPQGDLWFCYVGDYDETNILIRSFGNNPNQQMGVRFGDYNQDEQSAVTANYNERSMMHLTKSVFENITSGTSFSFNVTSLNSARNNIILNAQELRNSEAFRPQIARYYGFKVVNGNTTLVDLKPALDVNDNPCFYDEVSKTYIYHTGSGTPIAGAVLPSPDYQSGYTSGYTDGYASGYTIGYTSGQTVGYNSGATDGSKAGLYYAYYPTIEGITATTGASYYTVFPNLEDGKIIKCGVLSKNHFSNHILGGKSQQSEPLINFGVDNINNETDFAITSEITSGYSLSYPLPITGDNHYSVVYMAISGGSYCFGLEVGGYFYGGFNPSNINWTGTGISNEYNIIFNSDTISGMSLDYVIYKDIETDVIEHYYTIDPKTNEIHDWMTGNDLPTYDANNNRVYNVLQSVLKI